MTSSFHDNASPLPDQESYLKGYWTGYHEGETERIWLATANSELRSEVLARSEEMERLVARIIEINSLPWSCDIAEELADLAQELTETKGSK